MPQRLIPVLLRSWLMALRHSVVRLSSLILLDALDVVLRQLPITAYINVLFVLLLFDRV